MLPIEMTLLSLESIPEDGDPILSLYLLTDPSTALGRNLHAQLSAVGQSLKHDLGPDGAAVELLERELDDARIFLDSLGESPRSLAIFSSAARGLFKSIPLSMRVGPEAFWGSAPYLRPLFAALDEFEPTMVVLLDNERARLFRVFLEQIEQVEEFEDHVPGKHRQSGGAWAPPPGTWAQGGWGDAGIQRRHEQYVRAHARHAVDALVSQAASEPFDRLVLGGSQEALVEFRRLLPRRFRSRVAGEMHLRVNASPGEILSAVRKLSEQHERLEEQHLIEELAESLGQEMAVVGAAEVAQAVTQRQAYVLVFARDTRVSGGVCEQCHVVAVPPFGERCLGCGGDIRRVADLVEHLLRRVLAAGGRIEEVRGPAAERLSQLGGIGAFLRYSVAGAEAAAEAPVEIVR